MQNTIYSSLVLTGAATVDKNPSCLGMISYALTMNIAHALYYNLAHDKSFKPTVITILPTPIDTP